MKGREKRTTAGRRMNALVGEEEEKDKSFWGHDTWTEENDDSEFSDTEASSDEFDTDFNESESDEDEGEDEEAEKRIKAREKKQTKSQVYKEPKAAKPALTPEQLAEAKAKRAEAKRLAAESLMVVERSKRESTLKKSEAIQKQMQRYETAQARAQAAYAAKPRRTKCIFTQEMMLKEACGTEHENARWLLARKRLLNEADHVAGSSAPKRQIQLSSRFFSRRGSNTMINFPDVDLMPEILGPHDPPKPVKETKCVITGLPAKYKDPLTGAPYATIEAFRLLRQRHARRTGGMS